MSTLFTKILNGEIPGDILYKDDVCFALRDIQPQAPKHILVIPRQELRSVAAAEAAEQSLLGHLLLVCARVAREAGLEETGYRLVINTGKDGGQTVDHLHIHILGGRQLTWPPG